MSLKLVGKKAKADVINACMELSAIAEKKALALTNDESDEFFEQSILILLKIAKLKKVMKALLKEMEDVGDE